MNFSTTDLYRFFPSPLEHFPDRSARWLLIEPENVSALVSLVAEQIAVLLDFSQLTPLNRDFLSDTLRQQEADLVFSVPFRETSAGEVLLIHILIEHQSRIEKDMWFRFLGYMYNLWVAERQRWTAEAVPREHRRLHPILPILFYTGDQPWPSLLSPTSVMEVPEVLVPFVPTYEVLMLDVKRTQPSELTKTGHPFGWLLTVLQKENASKEELTQALVAALSELDALNAGQTEQHRRAIIYLASLIYHRRPPEEREGLIKVVDAHSRGMEVETMFQSMAEVTFQRGIEQGIDQGETRAKRTALLKLLQHRFQSVPEAVITQIHTIHSPVHLDTLFEKVLTTENLEDIDWQAPEA
jgi:hypothetical protein